MAPGGYNHALSTTRDFPARHDDGTAVLAADFQKGLTAAQSGDFAAALRERTPLAKQGYAPA